MRALFAGFSLIIVGLIALRPIPSVAAPNDTGRYVAAQFDACTLPSSELQNLNLSWRSFELLMKPTCVMSDPHFFLLCAGLGLPAGLLAFGNWNRLGTFMLSSSLLVSTVGFEFMTNALRQGVSLPFLLAGFFFERKIFKFGTLGIAMLLHDSTWFFVPLAIVLAIHTGRLKTITLFAWGIPMAAAVGYFFSLRFLSQSGGALALATFYTRSYAEAMSAPFLAYITSPLLMVFGVRILDRRAQPSRDERITFWYCLTILTLSALIFPAITYRFAMTSIALQVFMAARSPNASVRSGGLIAYGLIIHFLIYAFLAKNVIAVIYG